MGRCIAISEAKRHPHPLRTLPLPSARRSGERALSNSAATLQRRNTSASGYRVWLVRFWMWLLTPGGQRTGRRH